MSRVLPVVFAIVLLVGQAAVGAEEAELTLSIVIPGRGDNPGTLRWAGGPPAPHFHVILRNITTKPVRIFEEWNSWGYGSLRFEMTDEHGQTTTIRKRPHAWTMNYPSFTTIAAQEFAIIDVFFADRSVWGDGFWLTPGHPTGRVTLKAIYAVEEDKFSREQSVWTGKIISPPVECFIK